MTAKHVGAGVANGAEQPSILGWERVGRERVGRERFGEIVEGKHSHSICPQGANGQGAGAHDLFARISPLVC